MRKAFFFDLDGTLLPLDMEEFGRLYFGAITEAGIYKKISENGGDEIFGKAVRAMLRNDGSALNCEVFWQAIENMSGKKRHELEPAMEIFYETDFDKVKPCTYAEEKAIAAVKELKAKGYRLIIATNPLFPKTATDKRISWAGLSPEDFEHITYYHNSSYCKPDPRYYLEILEKTGLKPEECYMAGNDAAEDMCAVSLGFEGFWLLDNAIGDAKGVQCRRGNYSDLLELVKSLPDLKANSI